MRSTYEINMIWVGWCLKWLWGIIGSGSGPICIFALGVRASHALFCHTNVYASVAFIDLLKRKSASAFILI
jgi:hypothetical protein